MKQSLKDLRTKYYRWQYKKDHLGICQCCYKKKYLPLFTYDYARTRQGPQWYCISIVCEDCFNKLSFEMLLSIHARFVRKYWVGERAWEKVGKKIEHALAIEKHVEGYVDFVIDCPLLME